MLRDKGMLLRVRNKAERSFFADRLDSGQLDGTSWN